MFSATGISVSKPPSENKTFQELVADFTTSLDWPYASQMAVDYDSWAKFALLHCFVGIAGGMLIGFLPEAELSHLYYNTGLEPYAPAIATAALLLGYSVNRYIGKGQAATSAWVPGFIWMLIGVYVISTNWSANSSAEKTRWGYVLANLFGSTLKCSESECLGELFTIPFTASVTYSLGAYIRRLRPSRQT